MDERENKDRNLPGDFFDAKQEYYTDRTAHTAQTKKNKESGSYQTVLDGVPRSRVWSVIALIFGIISMVLAILHLPLQNVFLPFIAIVLGILAMLTTLISRRTLGYFDNLALSAIITGVMGIVFGFVNYMVVAIMQLF